MGAADSNYRHQLLAPAPPMHYHCRIPTGRRSVLAVDRPRRTTMSAAARRRLGAVVSALAFLSCCPAAPNALAADAETVTIYRDQFGIPNIFADTEEGAVHGMGYAQAEDRLEELLKQY